MSETAIELSGVSKRYHLRRGWYVTSLKDEVGRLTARLLGRDVQRKFDQIVAFSEVERFIDTPIKFYSSGMQMRLGFAVAAHTDPDILLIDEILAVGDASFQAKCLNKLAELKEQEKTIILVSHNLTSITEHAKTVLWID